MAPDVFDREIHLGELVRLAALPRPSDPERARLRADLAALASVSYYVTSDCTTARLPARQRSFVQNKLGRLVEMRTPRLKRVLLLHGLSFDLVLYYSAIPSCW